MTASRALGRVAAALALMAACGGAAALTVYTYTGLPLVRAVEPLTVGDRLAMSLSFASAPTTGNYSAADLVDYSAEIGALSVSKARGDDFGAHIEFDDAGRFASWSVVILRTAPRIPSNTLVEVWINSEDLPPAMERILVTTPDGRLVLGSANVTGQWSAPITSVPEPAGALLFALGLIVIARHRPPFRPPPSSA